MPSLQNITLNHIKRMQGNSLNEQPPISNMKIKQVKNVDYSIKKFL